MDVLDILLGDSVETAKALHKVYRPVTKEKAHLFRKLPDFSKKNVKYATKWNRNNGHFKHSLKSENRNINVAKNYENEVMYKYQNDADIGGVFTSHLYN